MQNIFNRRNFLRWIAVCSLPLLVKMVGQIFIESGYETLSGKHLGLATVCNIVLTLGYYLLLAAALYRALRPFAPQLTLRRWMATMMASFLLYALSYLPVIYPIHLQPTDWDESVNGLTYAAIGQTLFSDADNPMKWMRLLHFLASSGMCYVLLPAWVLGKLSSLKPSQFFSAGVVAAITTLSITVLMRVITSGFPIMQPDGCEPSMIAPVINAISDCFAAAIGATLGYAVLAMQVRRRNPSNIFSNAQYH
jgi:hypothetical protein